MKLIRTFSFLSSLVHNNNHSSNKNNGQRCRRKRCLHQERGSIQRDHCERSACTFCPSSPLASITDFFLCFFHLFICIQVVIDFTATWCGPCQRIAPFFEELSTKYPSVTFVKVDVDEMDTISAQCGVRCMPTFMVYNDGKKTDAKLEGASPDALEALVKQFA